MSGDLRPRRTRRSMTLRLLQHRGGDGTRSVIVDDGALGPIREGRELDLRARAPGDRFRRRRSPRSLQNWAWRRSGHRSGTRGRQDHRADRPRGSRSPIMSGTGLTHLGSADARDRMHQAAAEKQTDSMRMFLEGRRARQTERRRDWLPARMVLQGGRRAAGAARTAARHARLRSGRRRGAGLAGSIYRPRPGPVPPRPCLANEFSDHVTERHNYLWLAHSKLRQASLGPELLVGAAPEHVEGEPYPSQWESHLGEAVPFGGGEHVPTASPTSNGISSNMRSSAARATFTSISSAPRRSRSATGSRPRKATSSRLRRVRSRCRFATGWSGRRGTAAGGKGTLGQGGER